jgi:hypothetical protein
MDGMISRISLSKLYTHLRLTPAPMRQHARVSKLSEHALDVQPPDPSKEGLFDHAPGELEESSRREERMSKVEGCALGVVAAVILTTAVATAQTITFENDALGKSPNDFEFGLAGEGGPGRWEVVADKSAAGGKALAQLSANTAANRFLVAMYNPTVFANGEITTRCKPVSGRVDQACGLIIRAADARNYYIARSNALERNVRFYRVRDGERQQLATAENVSTPRGQWHSLTLRAEGNRYTVSLNGKVLHTTIDTITASPRPTEGRAGLWIKSDSVTHFDRFEIAKLP